MIAGIGQNLAMQETTWCNLAATEAERERHKDRAHFMTDDTNIDREREIQNPTNTSYIGKPF